jgi:hypothetical protein
MVVGVRRTGLCQELQQCWVFHTQHSQQFRVCIKNSSPPKGQPANLTQLCEALASKWTSIPVELFRHLVEAMPRQIEAVLRAKGTSMYRCCLKPSRWNIKQRALYIVKWTNNTDFPIFSLWRMCCMVHIALQLPYDHKSTTSHASALSKSTFVCWALGADLIECDMIYDARPSSHVTLLALDVYLQILRPLDGVGYRLHPKPLHHAPNNASCHSSIHANRLSGWTNDIMIADRQLTWCAFTDVHWSFTNAPRYYNHSLARSLPL